MRRAIALIELIFAIVIIAITLTAMPNLITRTNKASNEAITQEAISNGASYLSMIMSTFWDEESVEPQRGNPILQTTKYAPGLEEENITLPNGINVLTGKRVGSAKSTSRKFVDNSGLRYSATLPGNFGKETNESEPDDIDDFNNRGVTLVKVEETQAKIGDYKDTKINLTTMVNYIKDNPTSNPPGFNLNTITFNNPFDTTKIENINSTNIKSITLTLTSNNDANKKIILKAFSCNIGRSKLKERQF